MRHSSRLWIVLGIVLSVSWAVGAWHHSSQSQLASANSFASLAYKNCTNHKLLTHDTNIAPCEAARKESVQKWLRMGGYTSNNLLTALAPIPFIWLAGFILIYIGRIQVAGFRQVVVWQKLNTLKKLFALFCGLCVAIVIVFAITSILLLDTNNKIPASLPIGVNIYDSGDFVSATGTWVRSDLTDDTIANPIQTSEIDCYRAQGQCIQSTAYVGDGGLLGTEMDTFSVQKWTPDIVVYADVRSCAATVYTIDLETKVVSGAGNLTNQSDTLCKMNFKSKEQWSLLLSNGFDVYWKLHQQARPWLLRAIQGLFGHS